MLIFWYGKDIKIKKKIKEKEQIKKGEILFLI
jgi:phage pi2 protein 07